MRTQALQAMQSWVPVSGKVTSSIGPPQPVTSGFSWGYCEGDRLAEEVPPGHAEADQEALGPYPDAAHQTHRRPPRTKAVTMKFTSATGISSFQAKLMSWSKRRRG